MRTIDIKGVGVVGVKPDIIEVNLNFDFLEKTYEKSHESFLDTYGELIKIIKDIGFSENDLKTTNFNVQANYKSVKKDDDYEDVFVGYNIRHNLKLTFDIDVDRLGKLLTKIGFLKVTPSLNIAFSIRNKDDVVDKLLIAASKDALRKAEVLASAIGVKLGKIEDISYNWKEFEFYSDTDFDFGINNCMSAPSMVPDDIKIRDTINFKWQIED